MKIYVAHSTRNIGVVKRHYLPKLEEYFEVINPFGKQREGYLEAWETDVALRKKYFGELKYTTNWVVTHDLRKLDACQAIFVYMDTPSVGLCMELSYAKFTLDIPALVVVCDKKYIDHPWIQYCATVYGFPKEFDVMVERLVEWYEDD